MEDAATQILVIGGMSVLAFGFLLGIPMAAARNKASRAPRYLFAAHLAAIIQGGLLLALTIAVGFSDLSGGAKTVASSLFVGGVVLFDVGLTVNWLQGVEDAFKEKSVGNKISTAGTPLILLGTGILLYGVLVTV